MCAPKGKKLGSPLAGGELRREIKMVSKEETDKETATHSSVLGWRVPWTEEAGRLQSMGSQELDMTE